MGELPAENVLQTAPTGLFGVELRRRAGPTEADRVARDRRRRSRRDPLGVAAYVAAAARGPGGARHGDGPSRRIRSSTGQRVFHQKFGYGAVRVVDGDRLEIDFEKAGTKTVIHSFVQAA